MQFGAELGLRSARDHCQSCPDGIYSRQSDTGTVSSPSTSDFPCQYHSINAP